MTCNYIYQDKEYTREEIINKLGLDNSSPNDVYLSIGKGRNIDYNLKLISVLDQLGTSQQKAKSTRQGRVSSPERKTIRLSKEDNIRKTLARKGVPSDQIDLLFKYLKDNNIQEISTLDLAEKLENELLYNVSINLSIDNENWLIQKDVSDFEEWDFRDVDGRYYYFQGYMPEGQQFYRTDHRYGKIQDEYITKDEYIKYKKLAENYDGGRPSRFYKNISLPEYDSPNYEYQELTVNVPFSTIAFGHFADVDKSGPTTIGHIRGYRNKKNNSFIVIEVQSDIFQKNRDKKDLIFRLDESSDPFVDEEYYIDDIYYQRYNDKYYKNDGLNGLGEITKEEFESAKSKRPSSNNTDRHQNQFLQFLNKDNRWVRFFVRAIVQQASKAGRDKVYFPTGKTAAKVEGHDTLEDHIDKLKQELKDWNNAIIEKDIDELPFGSEGQTITYNIFKKDGELLDHNSFKTRNQAEEKILSEKKRIKEQIQHYQNAGLDQLKPIEAFYENRVSNILNKDFNSKRITDKYGYTWNEVDIPENVTIDLSLEQFTKEGTVSDKIKNKLKEFLLKAGFDLTSLDNYVTSLNERGLSFNVDGVNALVDLTDGLIALSEGATDYDFTEEVAHIAVEMSPQDSRLDRAIELVVDTETYKKNVEGYTQRYKEMYSNLSEAEIDLKVRKEVLGKLVAQHIFNNNRKGIINRLWQTLKSMWNNFTRLFKKGDVKALNSFIKQTANELVNGNLNYFNNKNVQGTYLSLDTEKYKDSTILSNYKNQLEKAIKTRIKKLKIYEAKGRKELTSKNQQVIDELITAMNNDKVTVGLVNFINVSGSEVNSAVSRLSELIDNYGDKTAKEIASELNHINNYIAAYKPILEKIKSDLRFLTEKSDESKEINKELEEILSAISDLETKYFDLGIPIFAEVLYPFASKNPNIKEIDDLVNILKVAPKDISFFQRFLDSMADSSDDILAVIDQLVKVHKERARIQTEDIKRKLLDLDSKLKASGVTNMEWIAEKDADGVPTGNFISDRDHGKFKVELDKFLYNLRKKYGYDTENASIREQQQYADLNLLAQYKKEQAQWFATNTQVNPKYEDIIWSKLKDIYDDVFDEFEKNDDILKYIANQVAPDIFTDKGVKEDNRKVTRVKELFQEWLHDNRRWSDYQNAYYYKAQLTYPSQKYASNRFIEEMKNPVKREYYNAVMEIKKQMDDKLPGFFVNNLLMPQIRKDFFERIKKDPKQALKELRESFIDREDDTEFGMKYELVDERNRPVQFIPVFFTRMLKDTSDLSMDITATMSAYADMANNYAEMNEIVDILELGDEILANRDIAVGTDVLSRVEKVFKGEPALAERKGGKAYDRFKDYMSMIVYGEMKADEKWLAGLGLNTAKVVDTFNLYTAIQGLGLNIYSAMANPILGNALVRQEKIAGQFIKKGSLSFADKTYTKHLPGLLGDIGSLTSNNKLRLFGEYIDVLQDHKSRIFELNADRGMWGRMFNTSNIFFLNHAGEHQIQFRTALAMAHGYNLKLDGKDINLWEALEAKDNRLFIKKGVEKEDGTDFTMDDLSQFSLQVQKLNQQLHGIYNEIDRSALQKWSLGRMALLFRKFIKPGFNRRFESQRYNYQLNVEQEGMYITTAKFIKGLYNELKAGQLSIAANWDKLEPWQKANVKRTMIEISYMMAATILAGILTNLSEDDDENWALNIAAYQANRIYTELRFYSSPNEALRILKSPAAGINQLQTLTGYFNILDPIGAMVNDDPFLKTYKSGKNEDQTYLWVTTKRAFVPTLKNIENWFIPDEQLKLYTQ